MTLQYCSSARVVALSTAMALFMAPIASAQTVDRSSGSNTAIRTLPLSRETFGTIAVESARAQKPSLLRQATAAVLTPGQAAAAPAQQKSWVVRHKRSIIFATAFFAALVVAVGLSTNWGDD